MQKKNKTVVEAPVENKKQRGAPPAMKVPIDKAVYQLLEVTSKKSKISRDTLVSLACEALCGSVEAYGYDYEKAGQGIKATIGTINEAKEIKLAGHTAKKINGVAVTFGAKVSDIVRDAIMAQRFNWQRVQPVNARSMPSMRLQMFELEQMGSKR